MNLRRHNRCFGRFFPARVVAILLNIAAEIPFCAAPCFYKDIIVAAFSTGDTESVIPLANFDIQHSNSIVFTQSSQQNQWGVNRQTTIGYFTTAEEARDATTEEAPPTLNLISKDKCGDLMKFLKTRPTNAASHLVLEAKYDDALALGSSSCKSKCNQAKRDQSHRMLKTPSSWGTILHMSLIATTELQSHHWQYSWCALGIFQDLFDFAAGNLDDFSFCYCQRWKQKMHSNNLETAQNM